LFLFVWKSSMQTKSCLAKQNLVVCLPWVKVVEKKVGKSRYLLQLSLGNKSSSFPWCDTFFFCVLLMYHRVVLQFTYLFILSSLSMLSTSIL
jgi:hypothetical protein